MKVDKIRETRMLVARSRRHRQSKHEMPYELAQSDKKHFLDHGHAHRISAKGARIGIYAVSEYAFHQICKTVLENVFYKFKFEI